jgi:predicted site-specific integrase-resolvase
MSRLKQGERDKCGVLDLTQVLPVPLRVPPEPWEGLASLVSRTAMQMGYKQLEWLLQPETIPNTLLRYDLGFLRNKTAYLLLARLLNISEETLYELTFHRFAAHLLPPEEISVPQPEDIQRPLLRYGEGIITPYIQSYSKTRVCPGCLEEEPAYDRIYWSVRPLIACLRHGILLVDHCPACLRHIPLFRIPLTRCPYCQEGDYRNSPTVTFPGDDLHAASHARTLDHLGIEEECRERAEVEKGNTPLQGLQPWQYFRLLESFLDVLVPFLPHHPFLRTIDGLHLEPVRISRLSLSSVPVGVWAALTLTFDTIFTSWPHNFIALLEALPSVIRRKKHGPGRIFGPLYDVHLYKRLTDPAYSFIHEVFEDYLKNRYTQGQVNRRLRPFQRTEIAAERAYITQIQATSALGIGDPTLRALIAKGKLRAVRTSIGKTSVWLVEKIDVEALLVEWKDLLPLGTVAQSFLGISKHLVVKLSRAELLIPARAPGKAKGITWYYKPEEVERFKAALLQRAEKCALTSPPIPLSRITDAIRLPLVEAVREILDGHLRAVDTGTDQLLFERLVVTRGEVRRFIKERQEKLRSERDLLTACEVMALFGRKGSVDCAMLKHWMNHGLLIGEQVTTNGVARGLYFRRESVEAFRRTYIFTKEAAGLLEVHPRVVYGYVNKGMLHPVYPLGWYYLFLREEVEALKAPDTLSICEAARFLGISRSGLCKLMHKGRVPYVQHPQHSTRKRLLRTDVEHFRAAREDRKSRV